MRQEDPLWNAAVLAIYGELKPLMTKAERGKMNGALKQLREIGATPSDIIARAKQYSKVMPPNCVLTITGLVSNWARCKPQSKVKHASHEQWKGIE